MTVCKQESFPTLGIRGRETHEDEMLKMKMKVVSMSEVSSRMMPPEVRVQGEEDGGVVRTRFLCLIEGRNQTTLLKTKMALY
ncbi:hypothetical protein E3N88_13013 [Mikania micrantha]|uniref:Uncharacterized protein n=1 Tax=Mikania micrantha TaxID=192012 RepID=A0A5N6P943_9ASTR|nr:hypothetical protein E3N88_13013 [Mikania micrantha]